MIRNYLKIAFRNLIRDRAYAILNLAGLSIGLASVIMIVAYVRYELSYDKSYSNYSRVYRLLKEQKNGQDNELSIYNPVGVAATLQKEFPGISSYTPFGAGDVEFKYHSQLIDLKEIDAGADFFKIFNFTLVKSNGDNALKAPGSVVITESAAKKYFTGVDPLGISITDNNGHLMHITGVIKDIPANTHFTADMVISLSGKKYASEPLNWRAYTSMPQYVLLDKRANAQKLESQFSSIYKKYSFPAGVTMHLQPVTDIHLRSHTQDEFLPNGDIKYVYIFLSVALLILFIASINYINLTTARSLQRAKEIGLRKVLGAMKRQLVIQFLVESYLFFFISTIIALIIAAICWPAFSGKVTAYQFVLPLFDTKNMEVVALIFAFVGLLAGAYPAFFLSSIQPARILRGLSKFGVNLNIRKALIVLQFTISGVLIISTIVIYQQLDFVNNARLGFNKDHLLDLPFYIRNSQVTTFKNELSRNSDIQSVTVATWEIGKSYGGWSTMNDLKDTTKQVTYQFIDADISFIKTMGINLEVGRDFSNEHSNDTLSLGNLFSRHLPYDQFKNIVAAKSIILNQEAVKSLGLKNPVGTVVKTGAVQGTIIGVVQDFNGLSLHQKISPVIIRCEGEEDFGHLFIRVSPYNTQNAINDVERQWKKFYPDNRFDFTFVDDKLQALYTADKRMSALFGTFTTLAIVIGCLGLFGMVSLTVQNRVKEIGIRKVLGASVIDITRLLSADFVGLVVVSFIVSSPMAWYFMTNWLQSFAYRVDVHWWVFLIAFIVSIVISLATLSFQAIRAAMANPVESLRSD